MKKTTAIAIALLALVLVFGVGSMVFLATGSSEGVSSVSVVPHAVQGAAYAGFCPPSDPGCHYP